MPILSTPFEGRFKLFLAAWKALATDKWVLDIIRSSYIIEFTVMPLSCCPPQSTCMEHLCKDRLQLEANSLLDSGVVELIPDSFLGTGFYLSYFLVPKKTGGWRLILGLRRFNNSISRARFCKTRLATVIPCLEKRMCLRLSLCKMPTSISIYTRHTEGC